MVIGVLFSVFSLMQFVFSPMWGRVSDRIGRRPVLLISLLGSVVFYALYAVAVSLDATQASLALGLMLLARVGAGIAGASVGTAAAVIADCTTPEKRAKGMALIGIAFGAGFTLGPLIAYFGLAIFAQEPWGVGALASGLSLVALVIALAIFKETRDPNNKAAKEFFSLAKTRDVLAMPTVGALVLIYFLAIFAFANFEATLALLDEVRVQDERRRQLPSLRIRRRGADVRGRRVPADGEEAARNRVARVRCGRDDLRLRRRSRWWGISRPNRSARVTTS